MAELKLGKLPDRTLVKLTINVSPDLHRLLAEYADAYETVYGQRESVADLVPFMLTSFLQSDRAFARARQKSPTR